ncbi:MAG: PAS domain-containing protein [Deltaproteobacteria bacterium]|nr:PAS domain-containing protein [Deltaproteobacteria bacterium]
MRVDHAVGAGEHHPLQAATPALDLDDIPDAVLVVDARRCIGDANASASALLGWEHGDLLGRSVDEVLANHGEIDGGHVRFLPSRAGVRARHRDGKVIPVEMWCCPHAHESTVVVLRRTSAPEPEHADDMLAQILHDLDSPLAKLVAEADSLDEREDVSEGVKVVVSRLVHGVESVDRLIKDLLDAVSLGASNLQLRRRPTELRSLVQRAVERTVAVADRARLHVQTPNAMILPVDESRIERVVANLLVNAFEHAPTGTTVLVRLDRVRENGCISVIDAGPRISARELTYVLERLGRTTRARARGGSGLRLYISKFIVEAHGGRLGVEPTQSGGASRFFVELPSN